MASRREREQRQAQREGFSSVSEMRKSHERERATRRGYVSASEMRRSARDDRLARAITDMPLSYQHFLGDRADTVSERNLFERAFGRGKGTPARVRARAEYLGSDLSGDWNWREWRTEYGKA